MLLIFLENVFKKFLKIKDVIAMKERKRFLGEMFPKKNKIK